MPAVLALGALTATRLKGLPTIAFLGIALVYIALSILIGYWAGRVARRKGHDFGIFLTTGFIISLCALVPGLLVVAIAYAIGPRTRPVGQSPPISPS
jgi:hypothetical protein